MIHPFRFSLKTLLRLAVLCMPFGGASSQSFGEEDAESPAPAPAAQAKVLPDSDADGRLRDALKGTAAELLDMVPITGGGMRLLREARR